MQNCQRTVGILTLGCKVNQYESEAIAERMAAEGFLVRPHTERCDVYILNTCTVTSESDRKARQMIRRLVKQNPNAYVLVTGCFAQVAPEQIAAIDGVDFICGNADKLSVVQAALELVRSGRKNDSAQLSVVPPDTYGFEPMCIERFDRTRAYIKIEDGCESRCAYCIIPKARGHIRSKSPTDVISEVSKLTLGGCREVVLTGIETASYGKDLDGVDLADLLCRVDRIPNIGRVRLGSLDPSLIKAGFVERIRSLRSLAPHFHLSMQSGSDSVLARMRRKYNTKIALEGIRLLREQLPNVQFTTDMIVGFPGETEEEFAQTLNFIEQVGFLMIHVFPYSRRRGTEADQMKDQISEEIKHQRVQILSDRQSAIRKRILESEIGKTAEVLFETFQDGLAIGHTDSFIEVKCPSAEPLHACLLPVRITGTDGISCTGEILNV